ncbi:MAG: phosphoglucomutase/phosphomannomutase family protein [Chloroflexota bacterium]
MAIKFGTDGWRGVIAEDFTFANVRACAQGLANYLKERGGHGKGLVIGYDTRFASEAFAAAAAEVAAGNGIKALLSSRAVPTPVTSYAVVHNRSAGAIVITASHNPPEWNGFKVKSESGATATPEATAELEKHVAAVTADMVKRTPLEQARKDGLVRLEDLEPPYIQQLSRLADLETLRRADLNVVVDSMYGAGSGYFNRLLGGGRLKLTEMHAERNPAFPGMRQPEPIAPNLGGLIAEVKRKGASVGLATDGDADRLGIVDEDGEFLTQLQVFGLLCFYLLEVRGQRGPMVKTTTTTSMVFRLAELYGVPAYETPVGFKYVAPVMMAKDAIIGGEESGGYGFRGHIPERDGMLAGLYLLDFMVRTGRTPSELLKRLYEKVGPHHYQRLDLTFPAEKRAQVVANLAQANPDELQRKKVVRVDRSEGLRLFLSDGSWLFARLSGTEPVLRIYAESPSLARSASLLQTGRDIAGV